MTQDQSQNVDEAQVQEELADAMAEIALAESVTKIPPTATEPLPANLPAKFRDPDTGGVRLEALVNSYVALEKRLSHLSTPPKSPEEKERLLRLLGRPESPLEYAVDLPHGLLSVDPEVNDRLHRCGCTQEQVQEVYNLAGEKLMQAIQKMAADVEADREVERLVAYFGGADKWSEVARQLLAFGQNTLPPHVLENLASSFEGVLALHRMMTAGVPAIPGARGSSADATALSADKKALDAMLHDKRYWKERDPTFIAEVTAGFERLYSRNT